MKIIQISTIYDSNSEEKSIYGLGDDGVVYYYNRNYERWVELVRSDAVKKNTNG